MLSGGWGEEWSAAEHNHGRFIDSLTIRGKWYLAGDLNWNISPSRVRNAEDRAAGQPLASRARCWGIVAATVGTGGGLPITRSLVHSCIDGRGPFGQCMRPAARASLQLRSGQILTEQPLS